MNDVTIRHNQERDRFEVWSGDDVIGKAAYKEYDGGGAPQPVCPYIKKYIGKHPEYAAATVAITPAHLEFLTTALAARA